MRIRKFVTEVLSLAIFYYLNNNQTLSALLLFPHLPPSQLLLIITMHRVKIVSHLCATMKAVSILQTAATQ
jgi:hypothetical protein